MSFIHSLTRRIKVAQRQCVMDCADQLLIGFEETLGSCSQLGYTLFLSCTNNLPFFMAALYIHKLLLLFRIFILPFSPILTISESLAGPT